ncbi:nucleotidyltransferase family protein [Planktotalea arctica]|uniref:nucleotidyltransferase family protein n=1 Tax=Planktotalea arctica TaxID=1481893 RepID=UPI0032199767
MRDRPDAIMLFAAGFGTRMRHLTADRPKPLVKVAGHTLLDHALAQTDGVALTRKVVNSHYFPDQIKAHLANRPDVTVIHEGGEILETGGGLKNALPVLENSPVFTMNTDAVWQGENPLQALLDAWEPNKMDALLLCVPKENAIAHMGTGDFTITDDGRLNYGPGDIYSGAQIVQTDRLHEISETSFSLKQLWAKLLDSKRMYGLRYTGKWCDVGSPEGVELAETMLRTPDV